MYYVATSWDESGHAPSQEELDAGIENLRFSPGPHAYNTCIWQPHLASETLVPQIWEWIAHYCKVRIDYSTMTLADKQVWWLIVPENQSYEQDIDFNRYEPLITRYDIIDQIIDPDESYIHEKSRRLNLGLNRAVYPKIYMQVQSLMDYMYKEHSYFPVILNKPTALDLEFNHEFGSYFNGVPVVPVVMASFFSTPKTVKHHTTNRKLISTLNNSLTCFEPYPAFQHQTTDGKRFPNTYWWDKSLNTLGEICTAEECETIYQRPITERDPIMTADMQWNTEANLF